MAQHQKRRQAKLERKRSERKATRREQTRRRSVGLAGQMQQAAQFPVLHSQVADNLWELGIGQVLLSRQMSNGQVAFASFLVDVFCLGVKDVFTRVSSHGEYADFCAAIHEQFDLRNVPAAHARKLVEGSVAFADQCGLAPHPEYAKAHLLFGDIDPDECKEPFIFGRDGKPFFVQGPRDSQQRVRSIISVLKYTCGIGNFDYLVGGDPDALAEWMFDADDDSNVDDERA